MHKIYSRIRFRIPKMPNVSRVKRRGLPNGSPLIKMILILTIAFMTALFILHAIEPIFRSLCEEKAKSIATIVSNEQAIEVVKQYSYNDLFYIERDNDGNIRMVQSNVIPMNEIISNVPVRIQEEINKIGRDNVEIPLRKLYGYTFFSRKRTGNSYTNFFNR